MHTAEHVFYNDGTDEDVYAIVTKDNGDGNLNLFVLPASGTGYGANGVPHREKADYGAEGGGDTWHE